MLSTNSEIVRCAVCYTLPMHDDTSSFFSGSDSLYIKFLEWYISFEGAIEHCQQIIVLLYFIFSYNYTLVNCLPKCLLLLWRHTDANKMSQTFGKVLFKSQKYNLEIPGKSKVKSYKLLMQKGSCMWWCKSIIWWVFFTKARIFYYSFTVILWQKDNKKQGNWLLVSSK